MFNIIKTLKNKNNSLSDTEIASLLHTNPDVLKVLEAEYQKLTDSFAVHTDNFFDINAKQAAENHSSTNVDSDSNSEEYKEKLIENIVKSLIGGTKVWTYDGNIQYHERLPYVDAKSVTLEEINYLPKNLRPQLTEKYVKRDITEPAYPVVLEMWTRYLKEKDPKKKQDFYNLFRQGLDIQDLDPILYEILGTNQNTMGYWLPKMAEAVTKQKIFKIPKTTIIKVPLPILQLTRVEYESLTRTTLDIIDRYCMSVFGLNTNKSYFIKTGTYSSKYDFRNTKVTGPKEVKELGEYLLYIQHQATMMAGPLCTPCIYGVSTTNEWVVREFIEDKENNPCIYKGLPLHTEYRIFADFDTKKVIGISPYWEPNLMKNRFSQYNNDKHGYNPHEHHDYLIYLAHEETLTKRYEQNKDYVWNKVQDLLDSYPIDLKGQWSLDIMQNGDDFWFIDMALAQNSALIECVPNELRIAIEEDWIPQLEKLSVNLPTT